MNQLRTILISDNIKINPPINMMNVSFFEVDEADTGIFLIKFWFVDSGMKNWVFSSKKDRDECFSRILKLYGIKLDSAPI